MIYKEFIGRKVKHKTLGNGVIISLDEKYVNVKFNEKTLELQFPKSFEDFLSTDDEDFSAFIESCKNNKQEKKQAKMLVEWDNVGKDEGVIIKLYNNGCVKYPPLVIKHDNWNEPQNIKNGVNFFRIYKIRGLNQFDFIDEALPDLFGGKARDFSVKSVFALNEDGDYLYLGDYKPSEEIKSVVDEDNFKTIYIKKYFKI